MELKLPTKAQLRAVYEQEMRTAFPPAELKPLGAILEMWEAGLYRPWCLFDGEEIVNRPRFR